MSGSSDIVHRVVARTLRKRNDPHGKPIVDPSILKGVEIDNSGIVELWIKPSNPHCPCCLDDLIDLRNLLKEQRGVLACHIEVVGIPQSERWTAAVNE
ncbi:MAG TPA: iron-sulfur cluster assembly protein [Candidatus Thalassarchaeaceae archaeon]|jgi:metal-sulfur cluster biosynthetic enzyme|nr:iron-sulfur cluster assembly protein [Candidatus Thalassarchaeaceae archaeon]